MLQRLNAAAQCATGGDAENEIEPLGAAEIQHLGRTIMAVGAEQDVHARPVSPNGADQAAQKAAHLAPGGAAGGAQQGGDGAALAVEDDDRLEAAFILVGVEQAQLLAAMDGIEGVVDVECDAAWHLAEAVAVETDHGLAHAQQLARPQQVLEARDGWLRTQLGSIWQATEGELESRVVAQAIGVVGGATRHNSQ